MKFEDLVKTSIADLSIINEDKTFGFDILKLKIEEKLGHELDSNQLKKADEFLVNLNRDECATCTALPDGWVSK